MQNEHMIPSDPHTPPDEATVTVAAFGTMRIPNRLSRSLFLGIQSRKPSMAQLYCSRCGQTCVVHPDKITSLLQLVAVPPDMPDDQVPEGHDIILPAFDQETQYFHAANVCPACSADEMELVTMHLTIDTPDDTLIDDDDLDADADTVDAPATEIVG